MQIGSTLIVGHQKSDRRSRHTIHPQVALARHLGRKDKPNSLPANNSQPTKNGQEQRGQEQKGQEQKGQKENGEQKETEPEPEVYNCTVWFHELSACPSDYMVDTAALPKIEVGGVYEIVPQKGTQSLVFRVRPEHLAKEGNGKSAALSLLLALQKLLDVPPRAPVTLRRIPDPAAVALDTVEVYVRDTNFPRDAQWALTAQLVGTCVYQEQKLAPHGLRIGAVKCMFRAGHTVRSGLVAEHTSVVFRSESAKVVFLVQLAQEMWHFEESGEIMFHKLVNTLFPMVFKRWRENGSHHAITIVLFSLVDLTRAPWTALGGGERPSQCQAYYRVVVDQVSVFIWDKIMAQLRLEFANFKRDVLLHTQGNKHVIRGEPCPSAKGNLLEAINLALSLVLDRYRNTDLRTSVNHMVVVSPGTGLFDVDYELMLQTSRKMFSLDCALDLVCLSQPPLHTVPLFRYRSRRGQVAHCVPKWCDTSFYAPKLAGQWIPRCKIYELRMMGLMENEVSGALLPRISVNDAVPVIEAMDLYDDDVFCTRQPPKEAKRPESSATLSLMRPGQAPEPAHVLASTHDVLGVIPTTAPALPTLYTLRGPQAGRAEERNTWLLPKMPSQTFQNLTNTTSILLTGRPASPATPATPANAKATPKATPSTGSAADSKANPPKPGGTLSAQKFVPSRLTTSMSPSLSVYRLQSSTGKRPMSLALGRTLSLVSVKESLEEEALDRQEREQSNAYWMDVQNPLQPSEIVPTQCSRWADVLPPQIRRRLFKWRSLKAPAALPVATTLFPTIAEIDSEYTFQIYLVTLNTENRFEITTAKALFREMVRLRIAMGFQLCYGERVKKLEAQRKLGAYPEGIVKFLPEGDCPGVRMYLSLNEEIHRLFFDYNGLLNVQLYRKSEPEPPKPEELESTPLIRTRYADEYSPSRVSLTNGSSTVNWNQLDQLLAGYDDAMPELAQEFHKMKFVVMPGDLPPTTHHISNESLLDEEIRLEGLRRLIALIERERYRLAARSSAKEEILPEISFYTGNLHEFLSEQAEYFDVSGTQPANSLMVSDGAFNTNIRVAQLAQELQSEGGLKLVDRTWHFKFHPHCFLGSDLVLWVLKLFDDILLREGAVEYGQQLMDNGLFRHVENRHGFLDGHYFYVFCEEYLDHSYKKKGWFRRKERTQSDKKHESSKDEASLKDEKSLKEHGPKGSPTTPSTNGPAPARAHLQSIGQITGLKLSDISNTAQNSGPDSAVNPAVSQISQASLSLNTPTRQNSVTSDTDLRKMFSHVHDSEALLLTDLQRARRKTFMLSKGVKYNCDPQGLSDRKELVDVHYDIVHNPEHCFHIRLKWLNTTAKFIDETIINWLRVCERYGLKLVETPWRELCLVPELNPFHSFVDVKLAVNPVLDPEFCDAEILRRNRFYFHLHFLKVADFFLDNRGTSFFSKDSMDIRYSWGMPLFKYAQFIHKTGAYIVELRENGDFCMAPNNVHILRVNTFVNALEGKNGTLDSQRVMLDFREKCNDESFLRQVFRDAAQYLKEDIDAAYVVEM